MIDPKAKADATRAGAYDEEIVLTAASDVGREVLALIKRHTEGEIVSIEADLRDLGVKP